MLCTDEIVSVAQPLGRNRRKRKPNLATIRGELQRWNEFDLHTEPKRLVHAAELFRGDSRLDNGVSRYQQWSGLFRVRTQFVWLYVHSQ